MVFTFWSLYLYDRDLVYPKLLDSFIPQWLNHGMVSPGSTWGHFLSTAEHTHIHTHRSAAAVEALQLFLL